MEIIMKVFIRFAQGFIILFFLAFGVPKLFVPIEDLIGFGMHWMEDFSSWQIRVIGVFETLGVLGLALPYLIKSLPKILVPLAAAGLGITMIGAIATHIQRQDPTMSIATTFVALLLCAFVAISRLKEQGLLFATKTQETI